MGCPCHPFWSKFADVTVKFFRHVMAHRRCAQSVVVVKPGAPPVSLLTRSISVLTSCFSLLTGPQVSSPLLGWFPPCTSLFLTALFSYLQGLFSVNSLPFAPRFFGPCSSLSFSLGALSLPVPFLSECPHLLAFPLMLLPPPLHCEITST